MRIITTFGVGAVTAVLLGACGSSDSAKTVTSTTIATAATTAATTASTTAATTPATEPALTTTTAGSDTTAVAATEAPTTTVVTATSGTVDLATTSLGQVLVDNNGRTLYLSSKDTQNQPSTCDGTCAATWLPDLATLSPSTGLGLDATLLTELKRTDGSQQLAYNGWPLYRYVKDAKPGDVLGQGVGGFAVVGANGAAM
jgi:predicted lipoprotein with Yx(FWY)xxD motif